ncbi:MAG: hypothetical protein Q8L34_02275 [Candidatus Woesearchaeota archaeon]|nr:hypothetical protein [Candidatus Woesearchaeota archaeon]
MLSSREGKCMRVELRVIGPVFLVLLAGYLASSFHDLDFPLGLSSPTGYAISDQCPADKILFRVSGPGNAHAALANQAPYTYSVCWDGQGATSRQCNAAGTNVVLRLSAETNAHVEKKEFTAYQQRACFGNITCSTQPQGQCSTLGPTWRCVASLSAETNAHVSDCGVYSVDLCCSDGSTSGGGLYRPDTDNDGVFDIGLGSLVNTPCDPRIHSNLLQCADNCRTTVNPDQLDTDGDGAGDVCDLFINDSCSILVADDNCPYRQQCSNLAASWSRTSALEGESVGLTVTGSTDCQGKIAHFQVFDRDNNNLVLSSPQPATFANGTSATASSTWITEYFLNGSNHYYFQVTVTGGSSQVQTASPQNALLTVQSRPAAQCGNGIVEGSNNERCDDGNIQNGDGCSSTCRREINTNGQSCEDHPLCRGVPATFMVCQSDLTQSYFCLTGPSGCKVLSNPLPCSNANGVQTLCDRGAFTCRSPTCIYNRPLSPCVGGQQTRSCTVTSGGNHCNCESPTTETCVSSQEGENFPVFTLSNFLLTIVLLIIFYSFRRGVQWKSR